MIEVRDVRLALDGDLKTACAKKLRVPVGDVLEAALLRRSVDARRKDDVHFTVTAAVSLRRGEEKFSPYTPWTPPRVEVLKKKPALRPVVCGAGPAGLFAALTLARAGAEPILLERGSAVDERKADVEKFYQTRALDTESNIQFGEGGAGAFSDGKLNTGTHDTRIGFVLAEFAAHGAPEHITYDAKPHIGTDVLVEVVQSLRREVIARGGEVRFGTRLTGLRMENSRLAAVRAVQNGEETEIPCTQLLLAIGHSARDTFEMLHAAGIPMEPKPFSMGVRIEHPQRLIDESQYGPFAGRPGLPAADYKLNVHLPDGGSAYTFCMCPGGQVVASASETGGVVTNGMSNAARDGENANAALLVTLNPEDFPDKSTLGGMYWQRELERAAFRAGGENYHAPAQLVGDFLAHRPSEGAGAVAPTYQPGVRYCDLHDVLPERITSVLEQALPELDRRLHGFARADAVMTAPETRSSSPVRIVRGADRQSAAAGLYPCGEGAGYAGGIMSAAVDGMLSAEALIAALK